MILPDDDRGSTLRISQRRYPPAFFVTLNPWFYDRPGELEVVQNIRQRGKTINADAYGTEFFDGLDFLEFQECEWHTAWWSQADARFAKTHHATTKDRYGSRQAAAEMAAARAAAESDYRETKRQAKEAKRKAIKERKERWQREQAAWEAAEPARRAAALEQERERIERRERLFREAELEAPELARQRAAWQQQERDGFNQEIFDRNERAIWKMRIHDHMKANPREQTYGEVQRAIGCGNYTLVCDLCQELIREGLFHQGTPRPILANPAW